MGKRDDSGDSAFGDLSEGFERGVVVGFMLARIERKIDLLTEELHEHREVIQRVTAATDKIEEIAQTVNNQADRLNDAGKTTP